MGWKDDPVVERGYYEKEGELDPGIGGTRLAVPGPVVSKGGNPYPVGSRAYRNLENNNPGNMKALGGGDLSFPSREEGVAAIGSWLERAQDVHGLKTVRQLIDDERRGYAPSSDPGNKGKDLPKKAADFLGVDPDAPVDMHNPAQREKMVQAILAQEGNAGATGTGRRSTVTESPKPGGRFAQRGIEFEQGRGDTSVLYMDPAEYLALLPPIDDKTEEQKTKADSLARSLKAGDEIEAIPTLEVEKKGQDAQIIDYDGRHRAKAAMDAGLDAIPVAIRGVGAGETPKVLTGLTGKSVPFTFDEVPRPSTPSEISPIGRMLRGAGEVLGVPRSAQAAEPTPTRGARPPWETDPVVAAPPNFGGGASWQNNPVVPSSPAPAPPGMLERVGSGVKSAVESAPGFLQAPAYMYAGALRPAVGAAQLLAHGASAVGIPGGEAAARGTDVAARGLEGFIGSPGAPPAAPYLAMGGDVAASAGLPLSRLAQIPALAGAAGRVASGIGMGALSGATQPVTGQDYGMTKGIQTTLGGLLGGAIPAGADVLGRLVSPATLTRAAARLFGVDASRVTTKMLGDAKKRIGDTLERIAKSVDVPAPTAKLIKLIQQVRASALDETGINQVLRVVQQVNKGTDLKTGLIPGKYIDEMLHQGERPIETLRRSGSPGVSHFGRELETILNNALDAALPPAERAAYRGAKREYRDFKLFEEALTVGKGRVAPKAYVSAVESRFPDIKTRTKNVPESMNLARAAGEIWGASPEGRKSLTRMLGSIAGLAAGHLLFPGGMGAVGGGFAGWHAAKLAENSLARIHLAKPSTLGALRPGAAPWGPQAMPPAIGLSTLGAQAIGNQ